MARRASAHDTGKESFHSDASIALRENAMGPAKTWWSVARVSSISSDETRPPRTETLHSTVPPRGKYQSPSLATGGSPWRRKTNSGVSAIPKMENVKGWREYCEANGFSRASRGPLCSPPCKLFHWSENDAFVGVVIHWSDYLGVAKVRARFRPDAFGDSDDVRDAHTVDECGLK